MKQLLRNMRNPFKTRKRAAAHYKHCAYGHGEKRGDKHPARKQKSLRRA